MIIHELVFLCHNADREQNLSSMVAILDTTISILLMARLIFGREEAALYLEIFMKLEKGKPIELRG